MGLFFFYKNRRPRPFEHKPIYYDPHKEEMEERVRKIKKELGMIEPDEEFKTSIKGSFAEGTSHLKKHQERGETSTGRTAKNMMLLLALVLLIILFWVLFFK